MKRDIVDDLYAVMIRRYRKEHPELADEDITDAFADKIWYAIRDELNKNGIDGAKHFAENASPWQ